jgi:N-acetyl sugar amidotransferase
MPNNKKKYLLLFTSSFPVGNDEVFLENEIPFLMKTFEKIIVITATQGEILENKINPSISVIQIKKEMMYLTKIWYTLKTYFSKNYWQEKSIIKKKIKQPFSVSCQRSLFHTHILHYHISKKIIEIVKKLSLDWNGIVLYSYWLDEYAVAIAKLKKDYPEVSAITRAHGWDVYFERHQNNYLPLRYFTLSNLDKTYVVSEFGSKYLKNKFQFVNPNKIGVARLGTKEQEYQKLPYLDVKTIVSCSSIIPLKRIDRIIHALEIISDIQINWIHFGSGKQEEEIVKLAIEHLSNKKNINYTFKGHLNNQEILDFYRTNHVDAFINTSETEGVPVSIMEAMSFGIPCIAPNVGGIGEIINNNSGILINSTPNNIEISNAIQKIFSLNENEYSKLRQEAYSVHKKKFSDQINYEKFASEISTGSILPDYKECSRCLFTNHIYPLLKFDKNGVCSICNIYENLREKTVFRGAEGSQRITNLRNNIKSQKKNAKYDCIIGISGGVDSSYLVYLAKEWGLKPYVVHVDNGWNSDISVKNIRTLLEKLQLELHTHVINWQEMRDLQRAFIKASVLDIDLPFDNSCMTIIYKIAIEKNIKYVLTGHNTETEGWMPENFTHYKLDAINIIDIHKKFGDHKLRTFEIMGPIKEWYYKKIKGIKFVYPLDFIDYNKDNAKDFLNKSFGWQDYGGKHFENVYTRFYQSYILYHKFGIDKRVSHLSTLINSGQITKEQAKEELRRLPYDESVIDKEKEYFLKKLGFSIQEFSDYLDSTNHSHLEFKSYIKIVRKLKKVKDLLKIK